MKPRNGGDPEAISDVVGRWFRRSGLDAGFVKYKVFSAWNQVIDEKLGEHCRPTRFQRQILEVEVDSPSYYYELVNFRRRDLVLKVREICEVYVKDVRFVCSG